MEKSIKLVTEIPGPKSREIMAVKERYVSPAFGNHAPVVIDRAHGALITDVDGNTFIDLTGGMGVLNVGHTPDSVVAAIRDQAGRFLHTDFSLVPYESFIELARRLAELAPGETPKKVGFFNSGAEAVENSVKIARQYTGKKAVIAFRGAFHGRTLLAMTLTSKPRPYKRGFGPYAPEVYRTGYPYTYRSPYGEDPETNLDRYAAELEEVFMTQVDPDDTAAVIIEPVQGEGGFIVPPKGWLKRVREICDKYGVLMIVDEVQTGFGRTGKMFATEWEGIEPDLITVAKSLGAGMPISGVIGKAEIMDATGDSLIGGTYPGNPVACVAALEVLNILEQENLVAHANEIGAYLTGRFNQLAERYDLIGEVRGLGAMVGVELVRDRKTKEPAGKETNAILREAMQRGVIPVKCGIHGNVLRFLNPLVITDDQIEEAVEVLEATFAAVLQNV